MQRAWLSRLFFVMVGALAIAGIVGGSACTRWGQPGPAVPSLAPLSSLYVNPVTGSDNVGNGSSTKPYKTLTKAVTVLTSAKSVATGGVTIFLAIGDYSSANGEKFPIVVPTNVTIMGTNFGTGPRSGSFIDGVGQDTILESDIHAPAQTFYTTLEVVPPASVSLTGLYAGASKLRLPSSRAGYSAVDVLGTVTATNSGFAAGIVSKLQHIGGVLVAGGSLACSSCQVVGNEFGIAAFAAPVASASPATSPSSSASPPPSGVPTVTLTHLTGDSTIAARLVDLLTDGSANVTASDQTFALGEFAFSDTLRPVFTVLTPGAVDFGGGAGSSTGRNVFLGARVSEIAVTRRGATVFALDDTWNPRQQRANRNGQYLRRLVFAAGAAGKNVTILHNAIGSTVTVGPAIVPTPTPSASPSISPSPTTSPT